jgi:uncharacterized protein CbrC (UPF0167 family)
LTTVEQTLEDVNRDINQVKLNWAKEKSLINTLDKIAFLIYVIQKEFKEHETRFAALENDFGEHLLKHEKETQR